MKIKKLIYQSMRHASIVEKVPLEVIRRARNHPESPKGGFDVAGRLNWTILGPWITANREKLETERDKWQLRRIRAQALIAELEYEERAAKFVNKADVEAFQDRLREALIALFDARLARGLPARLGLPADHCGPINDIVESLNHVVRSHLGTSNSNARNSSGKAP